MGDGYMTIREAADYFGRPAQTIYRWIREGIVDHRRDEQGILVDGMQVLGAHLDRARRSHTRPSVLR